MIRANTHQPHSMISGINITPFTDVCLVLLIIFLVTANTLTRENNVQLKLPSADPPVRNCPTRFPSCTLRTTRKSM